MAKECLASRLIGLGFHPFDVFTNRGDFQLQDDSDGRGPYIREWRAAQPCPFPEEMRAPPQKKKKRGRNEVEHPAKQRVKAFSEIHKTKIAEFRGRRGVKGRERRKPS